MTAALAEACHRLEAAFPEAAVLVPQPDTTSTAPGGKPGSRPPWNPQAAAAFYDAYEGVRRWHVTLHLEVTGQPLAHVSTAARATGAHLRAIAALGVNAPAHTAQDATWQITGYVTRINQLPARDLEEHFTRINGVACYHCGNTMLRLGERSARVACLRYGVCFDHDGQHPTGFVTTGLNQQAMVAWADGCNQYADVVAG